MEEKNDFQDDETRRSEEDEEEFIHSRCGEVFLEFVGHLQKLLSCQDALARLSLHTERLLQHRTSVVASEPVLPRPRQTTSLARDASLDQNRPISVQKDVEEWEKNLIDPEGKVFPLVHLQSESVHWQKIMEQAQAVEDALRRLTHTTEIAQDEVEFRQEHHKIMEMIGEGVTNPYKSEVWTFRALQGDIDWMLPLIRAIATVCEIMGDFGHNREERSAAGVAYISAQLTQCATDLEQCSQFFSFYAKRFPKRQLSKDQARLLKDVAIIHHTGESLRKGISNASEKYSPPMIAKMMGLSADTVIRCIEELEDLYSVRTRKEIKAMKEEMSKEKLDALSAKFLQDIKAGPIKVEGDYELKPRGESGKFRRTYTKDQVAKICHYYSSLPSRWKNRRI